LPDADNYFQCGREKSKPDMNYSEKDKLAMYYKVVKGWYPVTDQRNITVGRTAASPIIHVEICPSTLSQHQCLFIKELQGDVSST